MIFSRFKILSTFFICIDKPNQIWLLRLFRRIQFLCRFGRSEDGFNRFLDTVSGQRMVNFVANSALLFNDFWFWYLRLLLTMTEFFSTFTTEGSVVLYMYILSSESAVEFIIDV